jgi:pilus assembly protein CpaB
VKLSQRRLARPSLGGLLATRQGSLTVAVLCAACAAGILMFTLGRYKSQVHTVPQQTTVLIATGEIQKGTSGDMIAAQKLYKATPIAAAQATAGAITNAAELAGETAQENILPGEQLTASEFSAATGVTGLLAPNQRAISVTLDESHSDSDVLEAGDHVDLYDDTGAVVILLDPNVTVIKPAAGTNSTSTAATKAGGTPVTGGSLVLNVDTQYVAEIEYAYDHQQLYVALRPFNATTSSGVPVTPQSILSNSIAAFNNAGKANDNSNNGTKS